MVIAIAAIGVLLWALRLPRVDNGAAPAPPAPFPRVSVIIPARDEERNLPALLGSLAALDPAPAEIIVVDDGSTDSTAAIAAAAGARVIAGTTPPPGWTGKPWACLQGARAASGELLLFTDADTVHAPASLGLAVARLAATGADLVSAVPTHIAARAWERLQGIFQLLLLVAAGRRFAIGQYLLFRREAYWAVGGHVAVASRIAEDLEFARLIPRRTLLARPGALRVRMYPEGLRGFLRGWCRNFRDGLPAAGARGTLVMILVVGWLLGTPLQLALHPGVPAAALTAATLVEVGRRQRLVGSSPWSALAYPLFVVLFVGVSLAALFAAATGRPVTWRRRRFVPRRSPMSSRIALLLSFAVPAAARADVTLRYETGPAYVFQNDGEYGADGTRYHAGDVGQQRTLTRVERTSVELGLGRHTVILLYAPFSLTTRATLDDELRFRDTSFAAGTVVDHRYVFDGYRASYLYRILPGRLALDLGGSLQVRSAEVAFSSADLHDSESNVGLVFAFKARARYQTEAGPWAELEADALSTFGLLGKTRGAIYDVSLSVGLPLRDWLEGYAALRLLGGGADVPSRDLYNWANFGSASLGLRVRL